MTRDDLDRAALTKAFGGPDMELAQAKAIVSMLVEKAGGKVTITAKQIKDFKFEKTSLITRRMPGGNYELSLRRFK